MAETLGSDDKGGVAWTWRMILDIRGWINQPRLESVSFHMAQGFVGTWMLSALLMAKNEGN